MSGAPFVVVIGPPGVGKSTVAAEVAARLGRRLVDTDALVEEREGRTISDLFVEEGEDYFRAAERRAVLDALREDGVVLALGGGAPMIPDVTAALEG
ncbi:shikimate kinase, partial [Janibacter sp. RAF20_2_2]